LELERVAVSGKSEWDVDVVFFFVPFACSSVGRLLRVGSVGCDTVLFEISVTPHCRVSTYPTHTQWRLRSPLLNTGKLVGCSRTDS
jgi:hypothetical protein